MKMGKLEKLFVNSNGHSNRVSRRAERLLSLADLAPYKKYLDVGTGNGVAPITMAQKYGLTATGIDVDSEQIKLAERASVGMRNVRFVTLDGTDLPFEDASFDIVSAFRVTHHIPDWQAALAEMMRVLAPGGYFVYSDFAFPAWLANFGAKLVNDRAGFPTGEGMRAFEETNRLETVMLRRELLLYEGVFRKPDA